MKLVTVGEIVKKFKTEGACVKFSPQTIYYMANKIGYHMKRYGGKRGYDSSLITAISRRFGEAVEYEKSLAVKKAQKRNKRPINTTPIDNYYAYNGERDNKDYSWESLIRRSIIESIEKLLN